MDGVRLEDKASRRRWFLQRMRRTLPSAGSHFPTLMALPREVITLPLDAYFGAGRYAIVGGVATRAYQPERATNGVDVLLDPAHIPDARSALRSAGGRLLETLSMPDSQLALEGETWLVPDHGEIDILWSGGTWAREVLKDIRRDQTGAAVASLAYLVLMKLDASRSVDQGDLARMLGLGDDRSLKETRSVVRRHLGDDVARDLESYVELGRLEVGRPKHAVERDCET